MKLTFARSYVLPPPNLKSPLFLIPFVILISICLVFVIYILARRFQPYPAGLVVSNLTDTSATISFVTAKAQKSCVFLYTFWPPQGRIQCDSGESKIHRFQFDRLAANSQYRFVIGWGWQWWNQTAVAATPAATAKDRSGFDLFWLLESRVRVVKTVALPIIQTLSKDILKDQNTSVVTGHVIDSAGMIQPQALVVVSKSGLDAVWATRANSAGNFSLVVSQVLPTSAFGVSVWSDTGYISTSVSGAEILNGPLLISVEKYAL